MRGREVLVALERVAEGIKADRKPIPDPIVESKPGPEIGVVAVPAHGPLRGLRPGDRAQTNTLSKIVRGAFLHRQNVASIKKVCTGPETALIPGLHGLERKRKPTAAHLLQRSLQDDVDAQLRGDDAKRNGPALVSHGRQSRYHSERGQG